MSTQDLCDCNGFVMINEAELQSKLSQHQLDLQNLDEILPNELRPTVEALTTPYSYCDMYQLYPGRVLIGHIENTPIWAYLWKRNTAGGTDTQLEYFVGDTDNTIKAGEDFIPMIFQKWCRLVACRKNVIGSPGWEVRVKTMVKLIMLRAGLYDGSIPLIKMALGAIDSNRHLAQSALGIEPELVHDEQESDDVMMDSSAALDTKRNRTPKIKMEAGKSSHGRNYGGLIERLRKILPSDAWFRVESCQKESNIFHEGKILIGKLRQHDNSTSSLGFIWAKVHRHREDTARSSRVAYFYKEKIKKHFCGEGGIDPNQFDFHTPFQLLVTKNSNDAERTSFRSRLNACVRAALLDYRPDIGDEFKGANFKLSNIIKTVEQNIQQQTKSTPPSSQGTPKETGSYLPSIPEGGSVPEMELGSTQIPRGCSSGPSRIMTLAHHETSNSPSPHMISMASPDSRESIAGDLISIAHPSNAQTTNETEQSSVSSPKIGKRYLDLEIEADSVTSSLSTSSQSGTHAVEHHKRRKVNILPMLEQSIIQTLFKEPGLAPNDSMNTPQERMATHDEVIVKLRNEVADLEEKCETLQTRLHIRNSEMLRAAKESDERIQDLMVEIHGLRKARNDSPRMSPVETHKEAGNQDELIRQLRADIDRLTDDSKKQIERIRVEANGEKGLLETRHVNDVESIKHLKSMNIPLLEYMDKHLEQVEPWLLQWKAGELEEEGNQDPEGEANLWFGETFWYPID